jgi:hypothetical protein
VINTSIPIFAVFNYGENTGGLSFNASPTASRQFTLDLWNYVYANNTEFRYMRANYNLYKVHAIELMIRPIMPFTQSSIKSLPSVFCKVIAGVNNVGNIADSTVTYYSDDAVECATTQTEGVCIRYDLPGVYIGTSGYAWAGSDAWISTYSAAQNPGVYLVFGHPTQQADFSSAANYSCAVYAVDVRFYTEFASPVMATVSV